MSWSVQKQVGKPEALREPVAKAFDSAAKYYEGKTEEQDVLAVKKAVLAFLDEAKCADYEGVTVEANGSRGDSWLNITVTCGKVTLRT